MTHETANDGDLRLGGSLWVAAGVCCTGLVLFVFVRENLLVASLGLSRLFLAGAVVGLLTGGLVLGRPGPGAVRWSSIAGVAWLLVFGALAVPGLMNPGSDRDPLFSLATIIGFGVAGALVTFWTGRSLGEGTSA